MYNFKRWPPLNCLRGFEAAARQRSFSRAAKELHMTQSAISHQIKTLETYLGQALFIRDKRKVVLSDAGVALLATTGECLDLLGKGLQRLEQYKKPNQVIVHTSSAFASNWLVAALCDFRQSHAHSDVWLYTTDTEPDLDLTEVHYAILHGAGQWPDMTRQKLLDDALVPLCSPAHPLMSVAERQARDLLRYELLHAESEEIWPDWFQRLGVSDDIPPNGANFSNPAHLLQAAERGQGIALGSLLLAAEQIAEGRLVSPVPFGLRSTRAYYLVNRDDGLKSEQMESFGHWLTARAKEFSAGTYHRLARDYRFD